MSKQPLVGLRIAVTRARTHAEELAAPLRAHGSDVLIAPLIRIAPSIDADSVQEAVGELHRFSWLVFSSANGVELLAEAMRHSGVPMAALAGLRIACVGPATAAAAARLGIKTDLTPDEFVGDALASALADSMELKGTRVLLARAGGARENLPHYLRERGAAVTEIELYRSVPDEAGVALLREAVNSGQVDVLTFTSGSTVRYFARGVGHPGRALVAVIGPATAQVAEQHGMHVTIEADPHTTHGLVNAIVEYFRRVMRTTEE